MMLKAQGIVKAMGVDVTLPAISKQTCTKEEKAWEGAWGESMLNKGQMGQEDFLKKQ